MYRIDTVSGLDAWTKRHGLSHENDTELNLRRITLLADQITQNACKEQCQKCEKRFKHRSDLLRHCRTIHGEPSLFSCQIKDCGRRYGRKDHLARHMRTHEENIVPSQRKRKADDSNETGENKKQKIDSTPDQQCNLVLERETAFPGKKFCSTCGELVRECR